MRRTEDWNAAALNNLSVSDPFWDYAPREQVERQLLTMLARQLATSVETKGYRSRISPSLLGTAQCTRAQLESLPLLSKQDLRTSAPDDYLVDSHETFHMMRATGGTTGAPVPIFWTLADWTALVRALQRFCNPLQEHKRGLRVWNGYNQAHVSGPAFDDTVRALCGTPIPRHFGASDRGAIAEIERMRATALVLTPQGGSGKGGSLEDLLTEDPHFLARLGIRTLLVSSTPLRPDVLEEVREQGVTSVINFYGSTEAPPAAISCASDPTVFHVSQGHVLVEVVGPDARHVRSGERGAVVVSRIASEGLTGLQPAGGTQLLRYAIGDTALYLDEPCACGRTSARIRDIARVENLDDKLRGGCERWE